MTSPIPNPPSGTSRRFQTVLLAVVVVLLAAILIVLLVNNSSSESASLDDDQTSSSDDAPDKPEDDPAVVAHQFISFAMVKREPGNAESLMCDSYTGSTPDDLLNRLTEWEKDAGVLADASVTIEEPSSVNAKTTLDVQVRIESGPAFEKWDYRVDVADEDRLCVSKVE